MSDPLSHDDLVAAKASLSAIVERVQSCVSMESTLPAVVALACAFVAACRSADVCFDAVLDQVLDADETGDLPDGVLDGQVFADTAIH